MPNPTKTKRILLILTSLLSLGSALPSAANPAIDWLITTAQTNGAYTTTNDIAPPSLPPQKPYKHFTNSAKPHNPHGSPPSNLSKPKAFPAQKGSPKHSYGVPSLDKHLSPLLTNLPHGSTSTVASAISATTTAPS
ncbi:hypothetical protein PN36_34080 [Candidatus Thiomargarita nelsonii]|uniref:Secreted protein n=1 Tax=Candidatus Thiomargarita nelsonii TaxID=1003181 RepID=A0A4E0QK30_9GAMM|nr:hypothetical protein PN36_34080 [Candidatus Thiomargarita nelsonii]